MDLLIILTYNIIINVLISLQFIIFIAVIVSLLSVRNKFTLFIMSIATPILKVARKITPRIGMFDFSPMLAILVCELLIMLTNRFFSAYLIS